MIDPQGELTEEDLLYGVEASAHNLGLDFDKWRYTKRPQDKKRVLMGIADLEDAILAWRESR